MHMFCTCPTGLAREIHVGRVWCGALQDMGTCTIHVQPTGKKAPGVYSACVFTPKSDERSAAVNLSLLKTAPKTHHTCTMH